MSKDDQMILCVPAEYSLSILTKDHYDRFEGFLQPAVDKFQSVLAQAQFYQRGPAETDLRLKQIITYTIITSGNTIFNYRRGKSGGEDRLHDLRSIGVGGHVEYPADEVRLNSTDDIDRTDADWPDVLASYQSEAHCWNPDDAAEVWDLIVATARREIMEETEGLTEEDLDGLRAIGICNTESCEVGRVHLGVVFLLNIPAEPPIYDNDPRQSKPGALRRCTAREDCLEDAGFMMFNKMAPHQSEQTTPPNWTREFELEPWSDICLGALLNGQFSRPLANLL